MKLTEIAERIDAHLKRFERDPKINIETNYGCKTSPRRFFHAGAWAAGRYVMVRYVSYQGANSLTREEATAYLAELEKGSTESHFALRHKIAAERLRKASG